MLRGTCGRAGADRFNAMHEDQGSSPVADGTPEQSRSEVSFLLLLIYTEVCRKPLKQDATARAGSINAGK
jgi:hypothetical protein